MARLTRVERLKNLVLDTYRELYKNCTTPVDFDELVENATVDEEGKKVIPYDKYYIPKALYNEIVDRNMNKMRLTKQEKTSFRFEMYLGCGPTYVENAHDVNKEQKT